MISPDIVIPVDVNVENPLELRQYLIIMKQYVEDLARKAQQTQEEVRDSKPSTNDLTEGETVPSVESGTYKVYRKISGAVKGVTMT